MAALTDGEKARILRHLGYANWTSLALSWQWDFPTLIPPEYIVADSFGRINDEGLELIRGDLNELDDIERQIRDARCRLKATKIGDIATNPGEIMALRGEFERWKEQLANDLGALVNPNRLGNGATPGGRNAKVI